MNTTSHTSNNHQEVCRMSYALYMKIICSKYSEHLSSFIYLLIPGVTQD